ncbi:MAG: glycosyltransferase family 9 protein [Limisphaerales bacterium]
MESAPRAILFVAASGIGNTILATPMIQRARELWPQARLDLLTSRRIFSAPLVRANLMGDFFDLEHLVPSTLWRLRRRRYDVSINCFPSNRWQFNLVSGIIGAKLRLTHSYPEGNRFSNLMNRLLPADESLHDIEQNLRLLDLFGRDNSAPVPAPAFALSANDERQADEWLKNQQLEGARIVGMHVGGNPARAGLLMNRPLGTIKSPRSADLQREIAGQSAESAIVLFGGAEEDAVIADFRSQLPGEIQRRCHRYRSDLWTTAALIRRCAYFVSGDTALMHIAAVFEVPQKAFFIASNPIRTAPRNPRAVMVTEKSCAAYRYPFTIR